MNRADPAAWLVRNHVLSGPHVILEPLGMHHRDGLADAVRDGEVWRLAYTNVPSPDGMAAEIERRLALAEAGSMQPFVVIDRATNAIAGMTTYMNVDAQNRRLEIGSTWYRASAQRTIVNTAAKRLLLTYAFDELDCIAVEFRTSSKNLASRRAIERLGAQRDGILRSHAFHNDGSLRDTYVYRIVAAEWPAVRERLDSLLSR